MALPSATVFEVRPTAGSDTNGGGFVSGGTGTDWSQQNSPQYSVTDGVTVGSTTVTSVTAAFGTDVVDNIANIGGSWFRIVSRTNATTIVVDRNTGTATGVTIKIGGAFATAAQANSIAVASNTVYIKASGTLTVTTALVIALDSTAAPGTPLTFIGYTTTRGDNGQVTWTTSTNSVNLVEFNQAKNVSFQNIIFTSTAGTPGNGWLSGNTGSNNAVGIYAINCKFSGFLVGIEGNFTVKWAFSGLFVINCRVTACTSHGIRNGAATFLLGTICDNNGGDGLNTATTSTSDTCWILTNSIFYKNSGNGVNVAFTNSGGTTMRMVVLRNVVCSTNTGAGVVFGNVTNPLPQISNSIFDANNTYGIDAGSGTTTVPILNYYNAFFSNITAATRNVATGPGTVTLSASPYVSLAGFDFSLNSTVGGGLAVKALGFPGVLQIGGTGYADIGALQTLGGAGTVDISRSVSDLIWFAD